VALAWGNLFTGLPDTATEESFTELLKRRDLRIERIVSRGQASPPGHWYDQAWDEWVVLISGRARISFESETPRDVRPGDFLHIPAHVRHRVDWTDPEQPTVWLAIHFR
jgi:cupin 2 domain-containing protein